MSSREVCSEPCSGGQRYENKAFLPRAHCRVSLCPPFRERTLGRSCRASPFLPGPPTHFSSQQIPGDVGGRGGGQRKLCPFTGSSVRFCASPLLAGKFLPGNFSNELPTTSYRSCWDTRPAVKVIKPLKSLGIQAQDQKCHIPPGSRASEWGGSGAGF